MSKTTRKIKGKEVRVKNEKKTPKKKYSRKDRRNNKKL